MLESAESEMVRLISREIIFAEFQPIWPRYLNVTDGQTDRRTTGIGNTALRVDSRGNKTKSFIIGVGNNFSELAKRLNEQENRKMSAQCALYMGALKISSSTGTIPNIFIGFCSDGLYKFNYIIWSL